MENTIIKFHLPDFYHLADLNIYTVLLLDSNKEIFNDNIKISSVYGTFPNAIWNGGRLMTNGFGKYEDIMGAINFYNSHDIALRFTWTNPILEEHHLQDTYCNLITSLANNGKNEILTNSELLEEYLRDKYTNYKFISSTTKVIKNINKVNEEVNKDYYLTVIDYSLNNNWEVLKKIENPQKCEILVNAVCPNNCAVRKEHYEQIARDQLVFSAKHTFKCPYEPLSMELQDLIKKKDFISYESIIKDYVPLGFLNFKLEGRTAPDIYVVEYYAHYLIKPEYQEEFIKNYLLRK